MNKTLPAILPLLCGAAQLLAQVQSSAVKLTGIVSFAGKKSALLEIMEIGQVKKPTIKVVLYEAQRLNQIELLSIDEKGGAVLLRNAGVETILGFDDQKDQPATEAQSVKRTFNFHSADLGQVLEVYADIAQRTVLQSPSLPSVLLDLQSEASLSVEEAVRALDKALDGKAVTMKPHGAKFVFAVPRAYAPRLTTLPTPPAPAKPGREEKLMPAGAIKFTSADLNQVFDIYQELTGRTILRPSYLAPFPITLRQSTSLTSTEAAYVLEMLFALGDLTVIPHGEQFVFIVPTSSAPRVAAIAPPPAATTKEEKLFPPGLLRFTATDVSQVLSVYAELAGRTPLRPAINLPSTRVTIRNQTPLTRSEALHGLDAVLALHHIKFVLVGDKQVKAILELPAK